ncbi:FG-GAP-like repeat-containing protein [Maioricimonas rarisocia]|uniref:FG-GAP-like repeat-containing protein n=1 Tax=Maioricimonas rarisocia TaxID=2528026 RepID=UPI0018D22EDA|nr:FG-GAP-like repeat-containing protein [Maioricimonas rarisocia]
MSLAGFLLGIVLAVLGLYLLRSGPSADAPTDDVTIAAARQALKQQQLDEAARICQELLAASPDDPDALLLAGELAVRADRPREAVALYRRVPESATDAFITARLAAGEVWRDAGNWSEAADEYRQVLDADPDNVFAIERMAFVLEQQGRHDEARRYWFETVRLQHFGVTALILLASEESHVSQSDETEAGSDAGKLPPLVAAARAAKNQQWDDAIKVLQRAVEISPADVALHARLGRLLADHHPDRIPDWNEHLPAAAHDHPDVWVTRGMWARTNGQPPAAARCYWEAARRDPNHRVAVYQLSQALTGTEVAAAVTPLTSRAEQLQQLTVALNRVSKGGPQPQQLVVVAALMDQLHRPWEAWAWYTAAAQQLPPQSPAHRRRQELASQLHADAPQTLVHQTAIGTLDLSDWPLPRWPSTSAAETTPLAADAGTDGWRFEDVAAEVGLEFSYLNGGNPNEEGMRMFEFTGGGIALLDYDRDGWPDIHLAQGTDWPPENSDTAPVDALFRNREGNQFTNVAVAARLADDAFSQGVATGDFNHDGWPDLYIAAIGQNRLYVNNGDGTFSDVTADIDAPDEQWTTSCLMVDLNGDDHVDLLDVNYLTGDDVFTRMCDFDGHRRSCAPAAFPSAADVLWLGDGTGKFQRADLSDGDFGNQPHPGLGAVAFMTEQTESPALFIANDATPNGFYQFEQNEDGETVTGDQALVSGLALDRDGRAQACMGIAGSDVNGDGRLDLFVTNYYDESNTLYVQNETGLFTDATRQFRLREPSLRWLGFGTQFLDVDLDGRDDLLIANGHVDDFSFQGIPFQMPAQLFRNIDGKQFSEVTPDRAGDYFTRRLLGRAIATGDWNRDGRVDAVVQHLDAPAALLNNQTAPVGQPLTVRLAPRRSPRDGYGTQAWLREGDSPPRYRQLVAGSGYQAQNEPALFFARTSPASKSPAKLRVRWRSGTEQTVTVPEDVEEIIVVEDEPAVLPVR